MLNFTYQNPVKIMFGKGQIAGIGHEIPDNAKILVTYGGNSAKTSGALTAVSTALAGRDLHYFGGIEANPDFDTLINAVALCRSEKIDFLIAIGGGSVIDGTKFIAAAALFDGDPWDIVAKGAPVTRALPLGCIVTLPATGSEMNATSVISRRSHQDKLAFNATAVYPRFSVLDPVYTYSLPPRQIGNGVVDSFVHVVEQYMTFPAPAPLQDRMAEGIMLTLIEEGPKTLAHPTDYDARANLMWCATMALNRLIGQGVPQDWSSHGIGHELTALYGLDHGQALAIVLPANLKARKASKRAKLLQYARRVWNIQTPDDDAAVDAAIDATAAFFQQMGVPTTMKDYGLTCDIDAVVDLLTRHGRTALGENKDVTPDVARLILALV